MSIHDENTVNTALMCVRNNIDLVQLSIIDTFKWQAKWRALTKSALHVRVVSNW